MAIPSSLFNIDIYVTVFANLQNLLWSITYTEWRQTQPTCFALTVTHSDSLAQPLSMIHLYLFWAHFMLTFSHITLLYYTVMISHRSTIITKVCCRDRCICVATNTDHSWLCVITIRLPSERFDNWLYRLEAYLMPTKISRHYSQPHMFMLVHKTLTY